MAVLIGFILSIITGYILIPILKKLKANQSISIYLEREHNKKNHTPTIGGLIFIIPTIFTTIILLILKKIELNYTIIILTFFVSVKSFTLTNTTLNMNNLRFYRNYSKVLISFILWNFKRYIISNKTFSSSVE